MTQGLKELPNAELFKVHAEAISTSGGLGPEHLYATVGGVIKFVTSYPDQLPTATPQIAQEAALMGIRKEMVMGASNKTRTDFVKITDQRLNTLCRDYFDETGVSDNVYYEAIEALASVFSEEYQAVQATTKQNKPHEIKDGKANVLDFLKRSIGLDELDTSYKELDPNAFRANVLNILNVAEAMSGGFDVINSTSQIKIEQRSTKNNGRSLVIHTENHSGFPKIVYAGITSEGKCVVGSLTDDPTNAHRTTQRKVIIKEDYDETGVQYLFTPGFKGTYGKVDKVQNKKATEPEILTKPREIILFSQGIFSSLKKGLQRGCEKIAESESYSTVEKAAAILEK